MERCCRCERNGEEVKLLDGVDGNEVIKICEECSLVEGMPIVRRPNTSQLKESEKPYSVRERLRRMAGLPDKKEDASEIARNIGNITLDYLRNKSKENAIKEKLWMAKVKNLPVALVDNYHWSILMERKKRKLTRKQLAEMVGES